MEAKAVYKEKAKELYRADLQTLIADAQKLVDSEQLPASSETVKQLKASTDEAKAAQTLDTMKAAYTKLDAAIKVYQAGLPLNFTVDLNKISRTIDPDSIFGINHRYAFNGYGAFDSASIKVKDDFTKLYKDAGFGSIRYPGGTISNLFNWKTTLGPKENRKKQIHVFYNNPGQGGIAPNFGIKEIADFANTVAPEEQPTVAPTTAPTLAPTAVPTEKPTAAPTIAPTTEPTAKPTEQPTEIPTEKPEQAGWVEVDDGWKYRNEDGSYVNGSGVWIA